MSISMCGGTSETRIPTGPLSATSLYTPAMPLSPAFTRAEGGDDEGGVEPGVDSARESSSGEATEPPQAAIRISEATAKEVRMKKAPWCRSDERALEQRSCQRLGSG